MNTYNEHRRLIARELEACGVTEYRFEHSGPHPRVVFVHGDREKYLTFSLSTACKGARHKILRDLRRLLGVRRVVSKNPAKRKRGKGRPPTAVSTPAPGATTERADPWAALKDHPLAPKGEAGAGGC